MTLQDFADECARLGLDGRADLLLRPRSGSRWLPVSARRHAFLQGLTVSGTAIGNTFTHPPGAARDREIAHTKRWIDYAVQMGAPTIRIFAGSLQKGTTMEQAREWTIDAVRVCCDYAASRGVILALENHGGIVSRADDLLTIVLLSLPMVRRHWDAAPSKGRPYVSSRSWRLAVTAQSRPHRQEEDGARRFARIVGSCGM